MMFCHDGSDACERCKDEQKIRALYERYRGYMERIARGDSYGATLAREALEVALDPEPEVVALRAEVARYRKALEEAYQFYRQVMPGPMLTRVYETLTAKPSPCYCGGSVKGVHSPSGCGVTEARAAHSGGMPPWKFDADPDGGAL